MSKKAPAHRVPDANAKRAERLLKMRFPEIGTIFSGALQGDQGCIDQFLKHWYPGGAGADLEGEADALEILHGTRQQGPFLRQLFAQAWQGNRHNWLMQMYIQNSPGFLVGLLERAGTRPEGWPPIVTLWRGGHGPAVANGWSWSTDRAVACFFSTYSCSHGNRNGFGDAPVVLRARVPLHRILHVDNGRQEAEAVVLRVEDAMIDGTPDEWKTTAASYAAGNICYQDAE